MVGLVWNFPLGIKEDHVPCHPPVQRCLKRRVLSRARWNWCAQTPCFSIHVRTHAQGRFQLPTELVSFVSETGGDPSHLRQAP